jgi:diguanylate cyclase (GGDEF)-like protein/putative nucleotidyltransferase with HDIG domain
MTPSTCRPEHEDQLSLDDAMPASRVRGGRVVRALVHDERWWVLLAWGVAVVAAVSVVVLLPGWRPVTVALGVLPLGACHLAYRRCAVRMREAETRADRTADLHMATIEALALAIDAKDQTGTRHIRRVQIFATGLARALGMSGDEVQGVRAAALLHDIGKLAVPDHILSKPDRLTDEEFQKVRTHPQVGAEIIAGVPFPYPVVPLVRSHHERWDGAGYPAGLAGEAIPLGARILSVVDYFVALTSERPYHPPRSRADAIEILEQEAGVALDPRIVAAFIELLPALEAEAERHGEPERRVSFAGAGAPGSAAGDQVDAAAPSCVFTDIALAHREIYKLYQIAQAMGTSLGIGDTMAILAAKLRELIPFSTCALFLPGEEEGLRCAFADGEGAETLWRASVRRGHGLVGWVARNRRALLNGRAALDFEAVGVADIPALEAALVSPLVAGDRLVGVLALYDAQPGRYTDDHRRLLERVCEQAAGVLANSVLFEQTRRDSLTDALTDLPNSRFMFVHLQRELARAERLRSEVSLIIMDVDDFKAINDSYGHQVGDRALREVARVLRSGIRPYDICVRYAGDEFVLVLSGCDAGEAEQKMRELQRALAEVSFDARPGRPLRLGGSFGRASFPADGRAQEALLALADKRMYEDKTRRKQRRPPDVPPGPALPEWPQPFANMAAQSSATAAD